MYASHVTYVDLPGLWHTVRQGLYSLSLQAQAHSHDHAMWKGIEEMSH